MIDPRPHSTHIWNPLRMQREYFEGEPYRIAFETQLLLDEYMVADRFQVNHGIRRESGRIDRSPSPVVPPFGMDDENMGNPYMLWDGPRGTYRIWYVRGFDPLGDAGSRRMEYIESRSLADWSGAKAETVSGITGASLIFTDREGRLAAIQPSRGGGALMRTGNGTAWTSEWEMQLPAERIHDLVYDSRLGQYLLYAELPLTAVHGDYAGPGGVHPLALCTSSDLKFWSRPATVLLPDETETPDTEYRAVRVFPYGHRLLCFITCGRAGHPETEIKMACSEDGIAFRHMPFRRAWMQPGQGFDSGAVSMGRFLTIMPREDRLVFAYTGSRFDVTRSAPRKLEPFTTHFSDAPVDMVYGDLPDMVTPPPVVNRSASSIGLATMRLDGFVAQRADTDSGWLTTREFLFEGKGIEINAECNPVERSYIKAELVRRPGEAPGGFSMADCDIVSSDGTGLRLSWRGESDLSRFRGSAMFLRLFLFNASVYSFRVI